jgi:hypothetical protein
MEDSIKLKGPSSAFAPEQRPTLHTAVREILPGRELKKTRTANRWDALG